jgi:cbb3-type cytochrome oxidase subunit 3
MLDVLRIAVTLAAFVTFLGIVWWAYAPSRKELWELRGVLNDDELRQSDE